MGPHMPIGAPLHPPWSVEGARCNVSAENHILFVVNVRIRQGSDVIRVSSSYKTTIWIAGSSCAGFRRQRAKWVPHLLSPMLPFSILSNWRITLTWMPILLLSTTQGVTVISSITSGTRFLNAYLGQFLHSRITQSVCLTILLFNFDRYLQWSSAWRN